MTRRLSLLATAAACLLATAAHAQPMFFGGYGAQGSGGVLASVNADGWSAVPLAPAASYSPDTAPVSTTVTRSGYDGSGNPLAWTDNLVLTQRVRTPCAANPCTAAGTLDSSGRTALSNWVCVGDTGSFTNNSTQACPTDIAAFVSTDHQVVGNSLTVEFLAYSIFAHSQGAPIPYASCAATDGTNTVTQAATYIPSFKDNPVLPDDNYDGSKLSGYRATINTTSLNNASAITVNCKAYPYDGGSGAILDSATSPTRGWSPQIYYKNTSPPTPLYVANTTATPAGSDSTGTGTSLLPYATVQKALNVAGAGGRDGLVINIKEDSSGAGATFALGTGTVTAAGATNGEVIIQADPAATGTVTMTTAAANTALNSKWTRLRNLHLTRGGAFYLYSSGSAGVGRMVLENVVFNNASAALKFSINPVALVGGSTSNIGAVWGPATGFSVFPIRGHTINAGVGASNANVDNYILAADSFVGITPVQVTASGSYDGTIVANVADYGIGNNGTLFAMGGSSAPTTQTGIAIVNNLGEATGTSVVGAGLSRDPPVLTSLTNVVMWNNTGAGVFASGRWNLFYDNNNSVQGALACGSPLWCGVRTHTMFSVVGNLLSEVNNKGDLFVAEDGSAGPDPTDAPHHVGAWPFNYGVAVRDNVYAYADANGYSSPNQPFATANDFSGMYGGLNAYAGTGKTTRTDLWTGYAGVTYSGTTYTAGAGNGTYTVCAAIAGACTAVSPAYQHFKGPTLLSYTLGGTARAAINDNAGAY